MLVSIWLILQTRIMEEYPEEITVVFLYTLCATLISAPGALVSSMGSVIHTWGLHLKGPVYISLFKPLSIVIAVIMGAIFLGDPLHLGSVIGSVILSFGFYTALGQSKRSCNQNSKCF